jgi:hypothetical protein
MMNTGIASTIIAAALIGSACSAEPSPVDAAVESGADARLEDTLDVALPEDVRSSIDVVEHDASDVAVIDATTIDATTIDATTIDARDVVDAGPPAAMERVSMAAGGINAITLDRAGNPSIAYGTLTGTTYALTVSTRGGAGWTHEQVATLRGAVARVAYGHDATGARHVGYAEHLRSGGVGYGFGVNAATAPTASSSWTPMRLADHSVNHNTAVRPDFFVTAGGDVHAVIPLTTATAMATQVRHLARVAGRAVDEMIAPRLAGSSFGIAIGRIAAAIHAEPSLSLFTVEDDTSGATTQAHMTTRTGTSASTAVIGSFPDLGSSLTEAWGADVLRVIDGLVAITSDNDGRFGSPTNYRVFRQRGADWSLQTIGPMRSAADNWCASASANGTVSLFIYEPVGMPVTATAIRLIRIDPSGAMRSQIVDDDVEGGMFCSSVSDAMSVHVAYRRRDEAIYYRRFVH